VSFPGPLTAVTTVPDHDYVDPHLASLYDYAGLVVDEQYGYWDRTPVTDDSPEIVTIVRRPLT
jgi:hypothetical protein